MGYKSSSAYWLRYAHTSHSLDRGRAHPPRASHTRPRLGGHHGPLSARPAHRQLRPVPRGVTPRRVGVPVSEQTETDGTPPPAVLLSAAENSGCANRFKAQSTPALAPIRTRFTGSEGTSAKLEP